MASTWYDNSFETPQPMGQKRFSAPLTDNKVYVFEQDFVVRQSKFRRLPIGTACDDIADSAFKLVREGTTRPWNADVCISTRTYAKAPGPQINHQSYAWRVPGYETDINPFPFVILSMVTSTTDTSKTLITTNGAHTFLEGDNVQVSYNESVNGTNETTHNVARKIRAWVTSDSFLVDLISEKYTTLHNVRHLGWGRRPVTKVVTSRVEVDYFEVLARGTRYNNVEAIPTFQAEHLTNNVNEEAETYSSTTTPTIASYLAKVADESWIVVEASIIREWMGHIYSRSTRYVRAQ